MAVLTDEAEVKARPPRPMRARWLALAIAAGLGVIYLAAITSTHTTLSAGLGLLQYPNTLATATADQYASLFPTTQGYQRVLWVNRPGAEITLSFDVHNGGPVPVTLLSAALAGNDPAIGNVLAPAGAQLGPDKSGHIVPFHPVTIGPGDSVVVRLTQRVVCDPVVRQTARATAPIQHPDANRITATTSPLIVRYRALGISMAQKFNLDEPTLIVLPYHACL